MKHKILHLCTDGNFIENCMDVFEHFYPQQNYFCIKPKRGKKCAEYILNTNAIWFDPYKDNKYLDDLSLLNREVNFDIIMVHGLSEHFNKIIKRINPDKSKKVYWIFWGYELYYSLSERGVYPLLDDVSPFNLMSWITPTKYNCLERRIFGKGLFHKWLEDFLPLVDVFCFWLYEDFLLLRKFYPEYKISFRHFQYGAIWKGDGKQTVSVEYEKSPKEVRIGHSASKTSNHVTIMKILKNIDKKNEYKKIVPLAYGSRYVKMEVSRIGKKFFHNKFVPIIDYVRSEEYFRSLNKTGVAVFGQLRQEASGNIYPLLKRGAKVFLRNGNPLLTHYRQKGFYVFSVEDDLKTIDDLLPLNREQMEHNAKAALDYPAFYEDFMPHLFDK